MAITPAERETLLKRLELARVAKLKKQEEAKAAKAAKTEAKIAPSEPVTAPVAEPVAPEPAPMSQEIQSPVIEPKPAVDASVPPPIPDLVTASRKKPAKKVKMPESDESEEEDDILPKKKNSKTAKKETPKFMKITLYKEPHDKQAFQSLLESIQNPAEYEYEPEPTPEPSPPPFVKPPRSLVHQGSKTQMIKPMVNENRALALSFFG